MNRIEEMVKMFKKLKDKKGFENEEENEEEMNLGDDEMTSDKIEMMKKHEDEETPEDEEDESDEYQALEDKYGIEKHKPSLFKKPNRMLNIVIAMGGKHK